MGSFRKKHFLGGVLPESGGLLSAGRGDPIGAAASLQSLETVKGAVELGLERGLVAGEAEGGVEAGKATVGLQGLLVGTTVIG